MRSEIRVERNAIFWSIQLIKNDIIFDKKDITLLFIDYFDVELLHKDLVHSSKGDRPIKFEAGMSAVGDDYI